MAIGGDSTTVFKADISNFKAAMQEAARYVRLANSEFKEASAGLGKWSDSAEGLTAKCTQLNKVLDAQKRQLDILENAYNEVVKAEGEDSKGAQELAIKLNNQKAAIKNTEAELDKYEKELNEAGDDVKGLGKDIDSTNSQVEKASDGFTVMKGVLANLVAQGIRLAVTAFKDLATEVYTTGANFESAMSKVSAISGANAEDMQKLTDKAKQMGETTVFSATQSAEAFNYMAMAGWKTEDMLNGIEGIMNLAAASGEDLATTSDIVTDALTAMGYEAGDAGKLADVMAAASSNANTNVSLMGQTFQYAAPIVGALGYNMEDTALAIGLMANAGIKGQKAGTALRSILTRLSAPPKECADAMEALGISLTDSEGNMKDFREVMEDLRTSFANLSQTEQTQYAKAIAGQEAMSGLLSIVNAGTEDFNKLTVSIDGSTGAASNMAKTMTNNVSGQLTLLKSNIEGKMIKVFEQAAPSIKKAIGSIGEALDSMDWDGIAQGVGEFAKAIGGIIQFLLTNGGTILNLIKNIAIAMGTLFVVSKVGAMVGAVSSLVSTYGSLNAIILLCRKSQLLLNAAQLLSPTTALVAGVVALTAGIIAHNNAVIDAAKADYSLSDAEKELHDSINATYDATQQLNEARDKNVESAAGEFNYIEQLKDEYNGLIDSNGQVKEGYEDRANFILTELSKALGIEKDKIGDLIDENGKLTKSIDEVIEKKKAEAVLSAYDESYKKAKAGEADALKNLVEIQNKATESEKKYNEVLAEYGPVAEKYFDVINRGGQPLGELADRYLYLETALKEANKAYESNKEELEKAQSTYESYQQTIKDYEGLSSAIISGDSQKIQQELTKLTKGFKDAKSATQKELEKQVEDYEKYYSDILKAQRSGNPAITKEAVDGAKEMVEKAKAELEKATPAAAKIAEQTGETYATSLSGQASKASQAAEILGNAATDKLQSLGSYFGTSGAENGSEYSSGVTSVQGRAYDAGEGLAENAKKGTESVSAYGSGQNFAEGYSDGIFDGASLGRAAGSSLANAALSALQITQKEGSPSKITRQSGVYFGQGYANGIESQDKSIKTVASALGNLAINSLRKSQKEGSPSKLTFESGVNFVKGYINGISSMEKSLVNTIKSLVNLAVSEFKNVSSYDFDKAGTNAATLVSNRLQNTIDYIFAKIDYQNSSKLAEFDKTISDYETRRDNELEAQTTAYNSKIKKLEDKRDNELDRVSTSAETKAIRQRYDKLIEAEKTAYTKQQNATKLAYEKLINTQKDYKQAYQTASQSMIDEFSKAVNSYQQAAEELINNTINGLTSKFDEKYSDLIDKQNTLVNKLKGTGSLFEISGAGVMSVNDLKTQTNEIKDYANKLKNIKTKVSTELFNEIAQLDVKEGSAFISRLLQMSANDLKAYNDAYSEKMKAAESAGKIYNTDISSLTTEYKQEIDKAFKDIPKQLEELGNQAMRGFIDGLTQNTDYMDSQVKTFVSSMISQFKSLLKIASPSKVMFNLGEYTGEGFGDGMLSISDYIKRVATELSNAAMIPIDDLTTNLPGIRSAVNTPNTSNVVQSGNVVNNYNLVQNNTSPKALTALETYQARRQQISLIKAFAP